MRIVRSGTWLYAGTVEQPVDIVALDYDFWFELARADGQLEPGEAPQPAGPDAHLYYARFTHAGELATPTWPDSGGHPTVDGAAQAAEERVPGSITWADTVQDHTTSIRSPRSSW